MVYGAGRFMVTVTGVSRLAMLPRIAPMDTLSSGRGSDERGNRSMRMIQGMRPWILGSAAVGLFHDQP